MALSVVRAPGWRRLLIALVGLIQFCAVHASECASGFQIQGESATLRVELPSREQAFEYLERTLADMPFFRANNYDVALPDHPLFDGTALSAGDTDRFDQFVNDVYRPSEFHAALASLCRYQRDLTIALDRLSGWGAYDGFAQLDSITVTLTLYGPGGSFDPDRAAVTLWTDAGGQFKGGGGLHTIVHEVIHIVIEHGIAQAFGLQHWDRERLVDLLAQREFSDLLPDYRLQGVDTSPMDEFVRPAALARVKQAVAEYLATPFPEGPR